MDSDWRSILSSCFFFTNPIPSVSFVGEPCYTARLTALFRHQLPKELRPKVYCHALNSLLFLLLLLPPPLPLLLISLHALDGLELTIKPTEIHLPPESWEQRHVPPPPATNLHLKIALNIPNTEVCNTTHSKTGSSLNDDMMSDSTLENCFRHNNVI